MPLQMKWRRGHQTKQIILTSVQVIPTENPAQPISGPPASWKLGYKMPKTSMDTKLQQARTAAKRWLAFRFKGCDASLIPLTKRPSAASSPKIKATAKGQDPLPAACGCSRSSKRTGDWRHASRESPMESITRTGPIQSQVLGRRRMAFLLVPSTSTLCVSTPGSSLRAW